MIPISSDAPDTGIAISASELRAMQSGIHLVAMPSAVFRIEGTGALQCVQGIFTNDVAKAGVDSLIWGAVLTAKGMIIFDAWVQRRGDSVTMIVPVVAHEAARTLLARTFPPRIAKVTDVTGRTAVRALIGAGAVSVPDAALPAGPAPFDGLFLDPVDDADSRAGRALQPESWLDASKVLAGWPTLGREIDDRTLPQEVRFDELDGVRYDKGCYTGQETVARLHFR